MEYASLLRPAPENWHSVTSVGQAVTEPHPDPNVTLPLRGSVKIFGGIFNLPHPMSSQTLASLSLLPCLSRTVPLILNAFLTLSYFLLFLQDSAQELSPYVFLNLTPSRV